MNLTEKIFQFINDYSTTQALLLTGEWGTGKTHFLRSEVIPKIKEKKEYTPYYVSLNGINSTDQIFDQLLIEKINQVTASTKLPKIPNVVGNLLAATVRFGMSQIPGIGKVLDGIKTKKSDFLSFGKSVFIFDDLERLGTSMDLGELLGFLHLNFIDNNSNRVIIVTNETQANKLKERPEIKEKVIGWTLKYSPDIYLGMESIIINSEYSQEFKSFLNKKLPLLISIANKIDCLNLRTFIFFLDNLHMVYPCLSDLSQDVVDDILYSMYILCVEFKAGTFIEFDSKKRQLPADITSSGTIVRTEIEFGSYKAEKNNDNDYDSIRNRFNMYRFINIKNTIQENLSYIFIPSIYDLITTLHLDQKSVKSAFEEYQGRKDFERTSEIMKLCYKLDDWKALTNDEFVKTKTDLIESLKSQEQIHLAEICFSAMVLYKLTTNPDLQVEKNEILNLFISLNLSSNKVVNDNRHYNTVSDILYDNKMDEYDVDLSTKLKSIIDHQNKVAIYDNLIAIYKERDFKIDQGLFSASLRNLEPHVLAPLMIAMIGNRTFIAQFVKIASETLKNKGYIFKEDWGIVHQRVIELTELLEKEKSQKNLELVDLHWYDRLLEVFRLHSD